MRRKGDSCGFLSGVEVALDVRRRARRVLAGSCVAARGAPPTPPLPSRPHELRSIKGESKWSIHVGQGSGLPCSRAPCPWCRDVCARRVSCQAPQSSTCSRCLIRPPAPFHATASAAARAGASRESQVLKGDPLPRTRLLPRRKARRTVWQQAQKCGGVELNTRTAPAAPLLACPRPRDKEGRSLSGFVRERAWPMSLQLPVAQPQHVPASFGLPCSWRTAAQEARTEACLWLVWTLHVPLRAQGATKRRRSA